MRPGCLVTRSRLRAFRKRFGRECGSVGGRCIERDMWLRCCNNESPGLPRVLITTIVVMSCRCSLKRDRGEVGIDCCSRLPAGKLSSSEVSAVCCVPIKFSRVRPPFSNLRPWFGLNGILNKIRVMCCGPFEGNRGQIPSCSRGASISLKRPTLKVAPVGRVAFEFGSFHACSHHSATLP